MQINRSLVEQITTDPYVQVKLRRLTVVETNTANEIAKAKLQRLFIDYPDTESNFNSIANYVIERTAVLKQAALDKEIQQPALSNSYVNFVAEIIALSAFIEFTIVRRDNIEVVNNETELDCFFTEQSVKLLTVLKKMKAEPKKDDGSREFTNPKRMPRILRPMSK
jgi:hypothetical protein